MTDVEYYFLAMLTITVVMCFAFGLSVLWDVVFHRND